MKTIPVKFSDIKIGNWFKWDTIRFKKISERGVNAVARNGRTFSFDPNDVVIALPPELSEKEKVLLEQLDAHIRRGLDEIQAAATILSTSVAIGYATAIVALLLERREFLEKLGCNVPLDLLGASSEVSFKS